MNKTRVVEGVISYTTQVNDYNQEIDSVRITCKRCGHTSLTWGNHARAIARGLAALNQTCPAQEGNFYVEDGCGHQSIYEYLTGVKP